MSEKIELYEDVLLEEPENYEDKSYDAWEKRLHKSVGWVEPEVHHEVLLGKTKSGNDKLNSSSLSQTFHWDVQCGKGTCMTCNDQEHAEIYATVLQINERLKRIEEKLNTKEKK